MKHNEHRRVKHGEMPGDVSRRTKIAMREKPGVSHLFLSQTIGEACCRSFRSYLADKGRTVQRRRDRRTIEEQLYEQPSSTG